MRQHAIARRFVSVAALAFSVLAVQAEAPSTGLGTAWERVVMEAAFSRVDTNFDGILSRTETARLAAMADRFDELDADHDGSLDLEEFSKGYSAPL